MKHNNKIQLYNKIFFRIDMNKITVVLHQLYQKEPAKDFHTTATDSKIWS